MSKAGSKLSKSAPYAEGMCDTTRAVPVPTFRHKIVKIADLPQPVHVAVVVDEVMNALRKKAKN